jgi:hypothetical protein
MTNEKKEYRETVNEKTENYLATWRESVGELNRLLWHLRNENAEELKTIRARLLVLVDLAAEDYRQDLETESDKQAGRVASEEKAFGKSKFKPF